MSANIADGDLLDIREIGIAELTSGWTALDGALERILSSSSGCNFNSFGSSI